jgi:hypothetical protein
MFYDLYPFVTYLLTPPRNIYLSTSQVTRFSNNVFLQQTPCNKMKRIIFLRSHNFNKLILK